MRIVIDVQGAQTESRTRGIGRYTLSFVDALVRHRGNHDIILALNGLFPETIEPIRAHFRDMLPRESIRVWYAPGPVRAVEPDNDGRRQAAKLIREAFLASLDPDIVYVTSLFEGFGDDAVTSIGAMVPRMFTAVTIYDLIPLRNPDDFLKPNPSLERWYRRKLDFLKKADLHLAISEATARDARDALSLADDRVVNVSTACSEMFRQRTISEAEKQVLFSKFGVRGQFVLCSGTTEPHKNLSRLFQAYARLPRTSQEAYQLLLIGKADEMQKRILSNMARDAGIEESRLIVSDYVSDDDLVALYNLCTVMVVPSYHEGFGLPALEAMSCGAAVIGSNTTSIPEVIGCEEALFDPHDTASIAAKLLQVLTNDSFKKKLKTHGLKQARTFSWDATAKRALTAFEAQERKVTRQRPWGTDRLLVDCIQAIARLDRKPHEAQCRALADCLALSLPQAHPTRQLFIDVSELSQRDAKTGCQRVTRSVVLELLMNPPEGLRVEPVYATLERTGYRYARAFTARLMERKAEAEDDLIDFALGDIFFGLDLQTEIVSAQQDFLLRLKRHGVDVRFLVYDILPVAMPHRFPPGAEPGFRRWLETLARFDGIIAISKATADALQGWYRDNLRELVPYFSFDWAHLGADIENSAPTYGLPEDAGDVLTEIGKRPAFLMVGTIEPRKGYAQTLAAFEALWAAGVDVNLVVVGKDGWAMDAFVEKLRAHPESGRRLFWLEGISDEYLEKIYAAASCLIAASEGEGFGLPLIEAARHKLPILARDIPVFREVAGEHASYFRGMEPDHLFGAIREWLALFAQGQHPKSEGMPYLTWSESAARIIEILLRDDPLAGDGKVDATQLPQAAVGFAGA